jgi:ABC-2 type transport system ATP-binding protein
MEEAQRLCDRVAIMDHGKILALDTVEGLIARHGGVSTVEAELAAAPAAPASLPGRLDGTRLVIETRNPFEEIARLAGSGVALSTLNVRRPDLESVFLSLTGRRLRDQ